MDCSLCSPMFAWDRLFLCPAAENRPDAFSASWAEAVQMKIDASASTHWRIGIDALALPGQAVRRLVQAFQKTPPMRCAVDKTARKAENGVS